MTRESNGAPSRDLVVRFEPKPARAGNEILIPPVAEGVRLLAQVKALLRLKKSRRCVGILRLADRCRVNLACGRRLLVRASRRARRERQKRERQEERDLILHVGDRFSVDHAGLEKTTAEDCTSCFLRAANPKNCSPIIDRLARLELALKPGWCGPLTQNSSCRDHPKGRRREARRYSGERPQPGSKADRSERSRSRASRQRHQQRCED